MGRSDRNLCAAAIAGCIFLVAPVMMPSASLASASPTGTVKTPVPLFDPVLEWPLASLQADKLWSRGEGAGVTVAVVDTGIYGGQQDLAGAVTKTKDLGPKLGHDNADEAHGTAVAGLIAGRGSPTDPRQIAGLAPEASLIDIRVANQPDDVKPSVIANGINAAVSLGAQIINVSLTSSTSDATLRQAVYTAIARGRLVIASAGDTGQPEYPADYHYPEVPYPGVLAVGAANQKSGPLTSLSALGSFATYAPGADLSSIGVPAHAGLSAGYARGLGGSDYATAFVSAAAALLRSADPRLTPLGAGQLLLKTAELNDIPPPGSLDLSLPVSLGLFPTGNLDAFAALERLFPPLPPTPPRPPTAPGHSGVKPVLTILLPLAIGIFLASVSATWLSRRWPTAPASLDVPW
jgi:membrane-anchored mycosin MYCP